MQTTYTGRTQPLLPRLQQNIKKAKHMDFIISFIRDSGIKLLINDLKSALDRGATLRLLTSTYLNVTEPNALYRLKSELNDKIEIKIYDGDSVSFHPKTYMFEYEDSKGEVIIGSSNISKAALVDGIEWNYVFSKDACLEDYKTFKNEFNELYEENSFNATLEWLRNYEKNYRKMIHIPKNSFVNKQKVNTKEEPIKEMEPIKFQIPALYELSKTREEGYNKALVIVATGLGKTYLSAFDTLTFDKVLFIAHRDEILKQSMETFKNVYKDKTMGFFNAQEKETDKEIIFGSIQTLGKKEYLNEDYFGKTYFDYIVIDEFHHAGAKSYENLIEYFEPKFLLGLTATPDRMDNKDIYKLCDYNIAYACDFKVGINNGWLVPFKYYGIYDDLIDYDTIPWRSGKYDIKVLEHKLNADKRAEQILQKYKNYAGKKTIGFCASIAHCNFMASFFTKHKIKSKCIHSESNHRRKLMEDFKADKIDILFVVDIFNEGVDIPNIDTVMFLRPTGSYTIFIQQLGRGLRTSNGKDELVVLDFVGNYKGSNLKPLYLMGAYDHKDPNGKGMLPTDKDFILPEGCTANFDLKLVDYFKEINDKKEPLKEKLMQEYDKIKENLNRVPSIMDMYENANYPVHIYLKTFESWYRGLEEKGDLNDTQLSWKDTIVEQFLEELEKTSMSKSYKIPTLLSLIEETRLEVSVSAEDIGKSFKTFYSDDLHGKDLNNKNHRGWQSWNLRKFKNLAVNKPIHFLSNGKSKKFFNYDADSEIFSLVKALHEYINLYNEELLMEIKDRLQYRNINYFHRKYMED
ncbi:DEAD/DEAH box helicase family protein [Marinisporobacter balticus]|uniref:Superfamily II DNA or RNA helicase n=1 Tax=Marinisporobacter balticus TaxID=2018667 RepID=A0A4R2K8U0_9FIRM|nr:DEAD/DEAH box helicase family protein [Marinisporobacter balticus]TCO69064.1 superfamily II DNA or RNA helicase [Marinisporobacter balticus]